MSVIIYQATPLRISEDRHLSMNRLDNVISDQDAANVKTDEPTVASYNNDLNSCCIPVSD